MKAQMHNYSTWIDETNPAKIYKEYNKLLQDSGFTILNYVEHYFQPQGYTALFLLGESHFAVHTFPEHNESYIELSSCVREPYDKFIKRINRDG
jgi:S-adenosylmethionine decarboxylase